MRGLVRVTEVVHVEARTLRVSFSDGLVRVLDFSDRLPGVFATIDTDVAFSEVSLDPIAGTVFWPGGIDLDPDVLHGDAAPASGLQPQVLREYSLAISV
jgi:Protein of unknown function (DUF2442)